MTGTPGPTRRLRPARLAAAAVLVFASLVAGSVQAAPDPGGQSASGAADQAATADAASDGRIAYAGTGHRSLGRVQSLQQSDPLFGDGATHFDDQPSARGDLLVFTSRRDEATPQVYVRDADGTVRKLTSDLDAAHPRLAPDGRTVVFDSAEQDAAGGERQRDLWLVHTDGTGLTQLTDTATDEISPTVSPDGTRIAYAGDSGLTGAWRIYRRDLSGGTPTAITDPLAGNATQPIWNPVGDEAHRDLVAYTLDVPRTPTYPTYPTNPPTGGEPQDDPGPWSTDAPYAGDAPLPENPRLHVIHADGSDDKALLAGEQADWRTHSADWLPDGDSVLFLSPDHPCTCDTDFDIVYRAVCHSETTAEMLLQEDRAVDTPTSLNGTVVVARTTASGRNVATLQDMRTDGADPRDLDFPVLTEDPAADTNTDASVDPLFHPTGGQDPWTERQNYTPDGRQIVVTRFDTVDGVRVERIWLVDADGTNPHLLLPPQSRGANDWDTDPTFSPDGKQLAFTRTSPGGTGEGAGTSRVLIADRESGQILHTIQPPAGQSGNDAQPTWSSDGTRIAFTRDATVGGSGGNKHIWTVPVDSLDQQQDLSATLCPGDCDVIDDSPAFSPDGTSIAFNRKDGGGRVNERDGVLVASPTGDNCQVVLPAGAGSCTQQLPDTTTSGPFQPRDVAYSPDGGTLVLSARRAVEVNSPESLALLDLGTGELTTLDGDLPGRQKEPAYQQSVDLAVTAPADTPTLQVGKERTITVTVTNHGPAPSPGTALTVAPPDGVRVDELSPPSGTCDAATLRCDLGVLAPQQSVPVTVKVTGVAEGQQQIGWSAGGAVVDPLPGDNAAQTLVPVGAAAQPPDEPSTPEPKAGPGVSVSAQPNPGYVGGRIVVTYTVRNGKNALATGLRLRLGLPAGIPHEKLPAGCTATECALGDLAAGDKSVVRVVLKPKKAVKKAPVAAELTTTGTDADRGDNKARTDLRVLQPRIKAVPPIGKPGFVTSVRGVDFPPGAPVDFTWKPGITAAAAPTLPAKDGTFAGQLLILVKDQTGPRTITASGPGFSPVKTDFLVVNGNVAPPDEVARR